MKCPTCSHPDSKVIDSRLSKDGAVTRRRRECPSCGRRFTTREYVEESLPVVVKKDGRREEFDRAKIILGLKKACEKRPVSAEAIESIAAEIERDLADGGDREVGSTAIGEKVMDRLRWIDDVAYVRFASVYRQFRDVREFIDELQDLQRTKSDRHEPE
ncbi:MAG: transcriptional repressor NrdR [Deltaproteobacteria bacterium]|nr:transcriptional repressor NrdR [Deltaproteobacteria bacterium]